MEVKDTHVDTDLSAWIDGELPAAERARVGAHLDGCGRCRRRLAELRATASLFATLPVARPSRSLVPSVAVRWNWLRPARSLSAFASGAFLFVFLLTAVGQSGSDLGGGPASPFSPLTQPAPAAAPGAPAEEQRAEDKGAAGVELASPSPVTQFAQPAPVPTDLGGRAVRPLTTEEAERDASLSARGMSEPTPFSYPPFWLALAVAAGLAAVFAHWRMRAI